ncbi:methyltranfer_dom domain-containing protein [Caerostris extrusa]|uniref:Methyltranfer_dom domain-containing protein n=1 Tax=Caerostris extrusa TaxID=172846 RepID=A0AAV4V4X9_CAEEX|nr:methyltranfer_dom domain-containing protein [Caerostris extrusa]
MYVSSNVYIIHISSTDVSIIPDVCAISGISLQVDGKKLDHYDRFGGKAQASLCPVLKLGSCCTIVRKYLGLLAYLSIIVGTAFLVCCAFWLPDIRLWCKMSDLNPKGCRQLPVDARERAVRLRSSDALHPPPPGSLSDIGGAGGKRGRNKKFDGDKVICLEPGPGLGEDCIVYSFGIANEWSFDESIHEMFGCQVFSFDPSMGIGNHRHNSGIMFYNTGIGEFNGRITVSGETWNMRTFDSILRQLGHWNRTIDVLKLDIEGAEYLVLEDILGKDFSM